ncbi:MAG: hypothetical protein OXI30_04975 [Chloroflexota bacterium]|nr:hypothetical protein [Chloroflexota bacterium]
MATTDIRLKRIENEYQSVRGVQDDILDRVDTFEEAILGLNQTVAANHDLTQRQIAELNAKLDAIIKHLDVPYKAVGFVKE